LGLHGFVGANPFNPYDREFEAGINFRISETVYDSGVTKRRIERSKTEIRDQEASIRDCEQSFLGELRLFYNTLEMSKEALTNAKKQRKVAARLSRLSRRSYELGAVSFKEMLDSEDMAKKSEVAYARAITKYLEAKFKLKVMMGLYDGPKSED
jgi:outer membrane protein TolC